MSQLVVRSSEEYWLLLSDGNSRTGHPALLYTVLTEHYWCQNYILMLGLLFYKIMIVTIFRERSN